MDGRRDDWEEGAGRSVRAAGQSVLRVRAALALVGVAAFLSILVGIINIGSPAVEGPLSQFLSPELEQAAGFTGTLTGFLLLAAYFGLRRGVRAAWYAAVLLLPVSALQGLVGSTAVTVAGTTLPVAAPLVAVSVLALFTVLVNYRVFDEPLELGTTQLAALAALVGSLAYTTAGSYALRDGFTNLDSLTDAFYFAIVTASTVGYGDLTPVTATARLFGVSALVIGTASFAVALGTLLTPAIEARLSKALGTMSESQLDLLDDHVIVVGVGDMTAPILDELPGRAPFVVITRDPERAQRLRDRGIEVITADPSDEAPLRKVGIERARALVAATNDDAQDALAILTARELNPSLNIVAAAAERENEKKLKRAGADVVISPAVIGGHLLVQSALGRGGMEDIAERIMDVPDLGEVEDDAGGTEAESDTDGIGESDTADETAPDGGTEAPNGETTATDGESDGDD